MGVFQFRKKKKEASENKISITAETMEEAAVSEIDEASKEQASKEQTAEEQVAKEQVAKEQEAKEEAVEEQSAGDGPEENVNDLSEEARWENAKKASPQPYEREDGTMVLVFAVEEETDSILPEDPRELYQMEGIIIRDVRLGIVSHEEELLADLPFYLCRPLMDDHVIAKKDDFALLAGINREEADALKEQVEKAIQAGVAQQEVFEENLEFLEKEEISKETVDRAFASEHVRIISVSDVRFSSGVLIAADPVVNLQDPDSVSFLREEIPAGMYHLTIGLLEKEGKTPRVTGMRLQVRDAETVTYQMAEDYTLIDDETEGPGFSGFSSESGFAAFCDNDAAECYWDYLDQWEEENPDGDFYEDCIAELVQPQSDDSSDPGQETEQKAGQEARQEARQESVTYIRFAIPDSEQEIIMVPCGFGSGYYSVFWGYDADGIVTELTAIFIDPNLYERM